MTLSAQMSTSTNRCPAGRQSMLQARRAQALSSLDPELLKPRLIWRVHDIAAITHGEVHLAGGDIVRSPLAAHLLTNAAAVFAGVCTLSGMDAAIARRFQDRQPTLAVMLEEMAAAALFAAVGDLEHCAAAEAEKRKFAIGGILEPGMEGFDVTEISAVAALAGAEDIGVEVSATGMLMPRHSLVILIAMGARPRRWSRTETCARCAARDRCPHRPANGSPS